MHDTGGLRSLGRAEVLRRLDAGIRGVSGRTAADEERHSRARRGFLRLGFERALRTTQSWRDLERRAPYMAQRALHCDQEMPDLAWVFLDHHHGLRACRATGSLSTSRLVPARGRTLPRSRQPRSIRWTPTMRRKRRAITLADDAYLEFLPDPVIPHRHARFRQRYANLRSRRRPRCFFRRSSNLAASIIIRTNASAPP